MRVDTAEAKYSGLVTQFAYYLSGLTVPLLIAPGDSATDMAVAVQSRAQDEGL